MGAAVGGLEHMLARRLAQSAERATPGLGVVSSSLMLGVEFT